MNRFTKDEIRKAIDIVDFVNGGITHDMIREYIKSKGWVLHDSRDNVVEWWKNTDDLVVTLPISKSLGDYKSRIRGEIEYLAIVYEKDTMIIKLEILLLCS